MGAAVRAHGLQGDRAAPPQERDRCTARARSTSSSTPSPIRSRSASRASTGPSICAIAFRVQDAKAAYERAHRRWAPGATPAMPGPGELNIPAIKGIGDSLIYFVDRWRGKNGAKDGRHRQHRLLRRGLRAAARRRRSNPAGPRPDVHRPPDAQRAPRPHEGMGRLLRAPVQLPRGALLRHRGPGHRREEQGDDQPLRQDPHPDQRGRQREGRARSRNTWTSTTARASSTSRWARPTCYDTVDALRASGVKLLDTIDTYYELVDKRIPGHGENVAELQAAQDPGRRQAGRAAAADLQREPARADLLRVHPAQGRRGLRRGQLQGAVRVHRARPDAPRRARRQAARLRSIALRTRSASV